MDIRECAWCGKAIYGDEYYYGSRGYYHKDCQMIGWLSETQEKELNKARGDGE
jgi:hypothetical protein